MPNQTHSGKFSRRSRGKFESAAPGPRQVPSPANRTVPPKKAPVLRWLPIVLAAVVLLTAAACGIAIATDPYDMKILSGVSIGGLDVGGKNPLEAHSALKNASEAVLASLDLPVELPAETRTLTAKEAKPSLRTWSAVWDAFSIGRSAGEETELSLGLTPYLRWNESAARSMLQGYAAAHDTDYVPCQWSVDGQMPDLKTGEGAAQTLTFTLGTPATRLDVDDGIAKIRAVYDMAFAAQKNGTYRVKITKVDTLQPLDIPELKDIHQQLSVAPVDDSLDMTTYQIVPGAFGYGFDLKEALKSLRNADFGETLTFPMTLIEPEITGDAVYFRDVLGYCQTPHTNNENRNHNLTLACQAMDGIILQPGDVFSYNDTLGERTKERGYLRAGAYSGYDLVQSYGGGICQGSSTIYCAVLYADLEIVFRVNHGYAVSYIDYGLDATVNWGGPDFQFRNNTHFPIKIAAEVSDGFVKVTILGTEERDYYVEMESEAGWGEELIYARSYKCKYDRETGELISRELEARSNYMR